MAIFAPSRAMATAVARPMPLSPPVIGAVLLIPALVVLLEAGVAALDKAGFAPYWSALIAGGGALLIGIILMLIGVSQLKAERLIARKAMGQLQHVGFVA